MVDFKDLPTEKINASSKRLDKLTAGEIVGLMNSENEILPKALWREIKNITKAVQVIINSLRSGGRIFFAGAGTSGRLGVLESAELPPTFNSDPALAQAIMAGGRSAVFRSKEGAEDNASEARRIIKKCVKKGDVVIGIAASGVTPFTQGALSQGKIQKARTILVTCNPQKTIRGKAEIVIAPSVGPEIISGSTRLKSGTATKMILNMLTTASMVGLGKVYGNLMVDLQPKSRKLRERGIRLVRQIAGVPRARAVKLLNDSRWSVKTAALMAKKNVSRREALKILKQHDGFLGRCVI